VPLNTPHGFVFLIVGAVASGNETQLQIRHTPPGERVLYCSNRPRPSFFKTCLPTFAGSFGWPLE